jgi:hypothetical protein
MMKEGNIKIEHLLGANSDLDKAYESKTEDGENVHYTTATSTNRRTLKYVTSALIRSIDDPDTNQQILEWRWALRYTARSLTTP